MSVIPSDPHTTIPFIVLYVGPDQIMPLTSVLGAIFGLALMFWNRVVGYARRCWMFLRSRTEAGAEALPESASNVSNAD